MWLSISATDTSSRGFVVFVGECDKVDVLAVGLHVGIKPKLFARVPVEPHNLAGTGDELVGYLVLEVVALIDVQDVASWAVCFAVGVDGQELDFTTGLKGVGMLRAMPARLFPIATVFHDVFEVEHSTTLQVAIGLGHDGYKLGFAIIGGRIG
jgi:hypothetical protein